MNKYWVPGRFDRILGHTNALKLFKSAKIAKHIFLPEVRTFGRKYSHILKSENRSSCSCQWFS